MPGNNAQARRRQADLEEIGVDRFIVRDDRALPLLRGEGELQGRIFMLQTWRRSGLLARLRERGFTALTLADRIARLPSLPIPPPIAEAPTWRALAAGERLSRFDNRVLRWTPLPEEERDGVRGVWVRAGEPLRRRRGRGAAAYYLVLADRRGGSTLRPLDGDEALLIAYAQEGGSVDLQTTPEGLRLPPVDLPAPHRALLETLGQAHADEFLLDERALALVEQLFATLWVELRHDSGVRNSS
jgi:hypothetical protein